MLAQFQDPLIYLLLGAIVIALIAWLIEGRPGWPVDAIMAGVRLRMQAAVSAAPEWATPVLYLRAEDGVLFAPPPEQKPAAPADNNKDGEHAMPADLNVPDDLRLSGRLQVEMADALAAAFDENSLAQLVAVAFSQSLAVIVGGGSRSQVAYNLVVKTESWSQSGVLLRNALQLTPNQGLRQFAQKAVAALVRK
jgi:hypothetical protein